MPFKHQAAHRHQFPHAKYHVTNWAAYEASLRQRGSLTIWFSEEAIQAWRAAPRTTRGGQPRYSPVAIETALTVRALSPYTREHVRRFGQYVLDMNDLPGPLNPMPLPFEVPL
ncbi:transposase [Azospirillum sp. TSA2s]|uniref:transposase n=1 Tax=Azospirillum sp. TSA2s TaxID=709810 RepID=UPI001FFFD783|nr:transposase [Azospirillum sp. TSA2s]